MKIMKSIEKDGEKQIASGGDAKEKIADLSEDKKRLDEDKKVRITGKEW